MTKQQTQITENKLHELFNDNLQAFLNARESVKSKNIFLNEMLIIANKLWLQYKNKSGYLALFIREYRLFPVVKPYYEDNGVMFTYNAKKDELRIFGDIKEDMPTYQEWTEQKKLDKADEKAEEKRKLKSDTAFATNTYKQALLKKVESFENKQALKQALSEILLEIK